MKTCAKTSALLMSLVATLAFWPAMVSGQEPAEPVRIDRDGLKLEMAPLGADPARAFFLARGFPSADAQHAVESACLFRSAIGSAHTAEGSPEVAVMLTEWRAAPEGGNPVSPKVREDWTRVWQERAAPEDAVTAFYWALFPTEQTFHPNDYNWGFLTFGFPPGTVFDLTLSWRNGDTSHKTTIKGLQCAH